VAYVTLFTGVSSEVEIGSGTIEAIVPMMGGDDAADGGMATSVGGRAIAGKMTACVAISAAVRPQGEPV
jgi:hypothetical protein